jgi:alcohol dehydrogenase (cytochrome c)
MRSGVAQRLLLRPRPDERRNLLTKPFAAVNWAKGVDEQGRPIPNPAKEPSKDGVLIAPDEGGATNFWPPSFDPKLGLLIVNAKDGYGIYYYKPEHGAYGWAGADYGLAGKGFLRAIDYKPGRSPGNTRTRAAVPRRVFSTDAT